MPEFPEGVTEGRAYHKGDVVLLRFIESVHPDTWAKAAAAIRELNQEAPVRFILLSHELEVVESVAAQTGEVRST